MRIVISVSRRIEPGAGPVTHETQRVRRIYDRAAPHYDRAIALFEPILFGDGRRWVASRARGETLEIGIGTGRNLAYYPLDVRLTGVDISPGMLRVAAHRARDLGREVDLRLADAQALDLPNAAFDTVVCTLSLCTIPDARRAVAEAGRVLRPGGRFVLLEHVGSTQSVVRFLQGIAEPLFLRLAGDHLLREPVAHLVPEGFELEVRQRARLGVVERIAARKPAEPSPSPRSS